MVPKVAYHHRKYQQEEYLSGLILLAEGGFESRRGSGTFVAPDFLQTVFN